MDHIPTIQQMPASKYKRPPFPVNDTKMPDDYQVPAKKQRRENGLPKK